MPLLRVVLDTNVLVSALVFRSPSVAWLLSAWQSLMFIPLASQNTMAELERVLRHPKFNLFRAQAEALIEDYRPWCEMVTIAEPPDVPECRDSRDRMFLELAAAGQADALVTGDGDLLTLAPVFAVPIITPAELMARLEYDRLETDGNR